MELTNKNLPLILLVEDDPSDIELLLNRFKESRLMNPITVVRDGLEAVSYLAGDPPYSERRIHPLPGIIILDLKIPKMDGFEVLTWIRSRPNFKRLPIVVLTSHGEDPMMERATACGAHAFLIKGVDTDGLVNLLQNTFLGWALVPV